MDGLTLLRRAHDVGLRLEASGDKLVIRGPKRAEPVVRLLAEHKAAVLAALADTGHEAELLSPTPWFKRAIPPVEGEPSIQMPCASRCGRVQKLEGAVLLHFCAECGAWGSFGYGVDLSAGRSGRWYCAAHRPQGTTP
ncbi:MAG: hypothetical protein ABSB37_10535 [Xanthobacteraceae bacterium]